MNDKFSLPLSRLPAAFRLIMDAQPTDGERFEVALKLASTSDDPATREAAALFAQWCVIGFCDPSADLTTITTTELARRHIETMRDDPALSLIHI